MSLSDNFLSFAPARILAKRSGGLATGAPVWTTGGGGGGGGVAPTVAFTGGGGAGAATTKG